MLTIFEKRFKRYFEKYLPNEGMIYSLIADRVSANKIDKQPKAVREKIERANRALADLYSAGCRIVCVGGATGNKKSNQFCYSKWYIKHSKTQNEAPKSSTYFETVIFQTLQSYDTQKNIYSEA